MNRHEQKGERPIRQLGFQETNIVAMAKPITKLARMIADPTDIPDAFEEAFSLAARGRPGPVLLDIPMDVQRADISAITKSKCDPATSATEEIQDYLNEMMNALQSSRFPLVLIGGGVRSARCANAMRVFVERLGVPVVHSLMAVDVLRLIIRSG